jgi:1-acyl-sn-glycerol-3-phosphate acyltransferase
MLSRKRIQAQGGLAYQPPRFVPWVYALLRLGSPTYLRLVEGIDRVHVQGMKSLLAAYRAFYGRSARLIITFRHASVHDPPVMTYLLSRRLAAAARRSGQRLGGLAHAHFLYGRGVTLWAGGGAAFLIPRIGALSVMNRHSDSRSMRAIREHVLDGPFPVALAPEGQVTYHNHRLGTTEPGVARLALRTAAELAKRGRDEEVLLLPLAIQYRYARRPKETLDGIIRRVVDLCGFEPPSGGSDYERLLQLTERLVERMEAFYARFYRLARPAAGSADPAAPGSGAVPALAGDPAGKHGGNPFAGSSAADDLTSGDPAGDPTASAAGTSLQERIERICQAGLGVPERFMGLRPDGDLLSRVFAVRHKGWDYLFRGDLPPPGGRASLEAALADRIADEAYLHLRHNELVDLLEYVRPDYIFPEASTNRLIEYALDLADVVNRLSGGNIGSRYSPRHKSVEIRIGEPLAVRSLAGRLAAAGRAGADQLMDLLRKRLERLSEERPEPAGRSLRVKPKSG